MTTGTPETSPEDWEPTAQDHAAMDKLLPHWEAAPPRLRIVNGKIEYNHPNQLFGKTLFMQALGITNQAFYDGILLQMKNLARDASGLCDVRLNFAASMVMSKKPRSEFEVLLAMQMTEVHLATVNIAELLKQSNDLERFAAFEPAFNRLARTFAAQMEALKRYQTGGEQKVTVQHVSVNEGGKAIVGNFAQGARESKAERSQPARLAHDQTPTMPIIETVRAQRAPVKRRK